MEIEKLKKYVAEHKEELKEQYAVEDVSVGFKVTGGERSNIPCIRLWAGKKGEFRPENIIPDTIKGVPTDVEEEEVFEAQLGSGTYRPLLNGCSIANRETTAGTLGFLYKKEGKLYWLSNAHVLAADPFEYISNQQTDILQPGPYHGGTEKVGSLRYMVLLNNVNNSVVREDKMCADGTYSQAVNSCDCALGLPLEENLTSLDNIVEGYKAPHVSSGTVMLGDTIEYCSWQSDGKTVGTVTDVGKTSLVNYGGGKQARFVDCILVSKMSSGGSSGSGACVVRDGKRIAVGLNFAGSSSYNVICAIQHVDSAFGGEVVTVGGGPEPPIPPEPPSGKKVYDVELSILGIPIVGTVSEN